MRSFPLFLIPIIPFVGALLNLLFGKRLKRGTVSLIGCGTIATIALLSTQAVISLVHSPHAVLVDRFFQADWITLSGIFTKGSHISAGLVLDHLSSVLLLVVCWIGLLIHIYSIGYMEHDPGYAKFFAYLNLFTGFMLILVLGDSLPITFVGWEGVGLCSYLLIGFWYKEEKNATAGRKAFIVNRIGDFFFLLGMCLLFGYAGTLKYSDFSSNLVSRLSEPLWFGWPAYYFIGLFLFIGCTGKSAQIPLYIWLPDAMAGPTPVSALIHAATMVTAGVYVIARTHIFYDVNPTAAKMLIAGIGALTALFAATIGLVQRDFKKVLAYSTVSQLGFMFVGVGTGAYVAAIFHLLTHAFFKAGLFLGAGSVMHAMDGEGDISKMGGLRKHLPITHGTFLVYCLAIAGIFPFAGFFSKDAILSGAFGSHFRVARTAPAWIHDFVAHTYPKVLWGVLLLAALCTAFYMWRLYFLVFHGKFRGSEEQKSHLHESPFSMTFPLVILAIGSIVAGFLWVPEVLVPKQLHFPDILGTWLDSFQTSHAPLSESALASHERLEKILMGIASLVSVLGILVAYLFYADGFSKIAQTLAKRLRPLYQLLWNKYYIDELYQVLFVRPLQHISQVFFRFFDRSIIDQGYIQGVANLVQGLGKAVRYIQNGQVQRYLAAVALGIIMIWYLSGWNFIHHMDLRQAADFRIRSILGNKVSISVGKNHPAQKHFFYRVDFEQRGNAFTSMPLSEQTEFDHEYTTSPTKQTYRIVVEVCDSPIQGTCVRSDQLFFHGNQSVIVEAANVNMAKAQPMTLSPTTPSINHFATLENQP